MMSNQLLRSAEFLITSMGLTPHPEGGYYKRLYTGLHIEMNGKQKALYSTIYYLLNGDEVSKFHRLQSDELWFYHAGSSFHIHGFLPDGTYKLWKLGMNQNQGEEPQISIPAGTIFGSHLVDETAFGLVSCVVSPGFEFEEFELVPKALLQEMFPLQRQLIEKLT